MVWLWRTVCYICNTNWLDGEIFLFFSRVLVIGLFKGGEERKEFENGSREWQAMSDGAGFGLRMDWVLGCCYQY